MCLSLLVFTQLFSKVAQSQLAKPARKQNLTRNSQSRSFKVMLYFDFGITEKPRMDCISAHKIWCDSSKPRNGWVNNLRLHAKSKYKNAIRQAASDFNWDLNEELSQIYLRKDFSHFWKKWRPRFSKRSTEPLHIDSETRPEKIAERFKEVFAGSSFDSYVDSVQVTELHKRLFSTTDLPPNNVFSIADIEHVLQCLKSGKVLVLMELLSSILLTVILQYLFIFSFCLTVY